jgi:hypothetical protein
MRPGLEANHSPPSSAQVNNGGPIPPIPNTAPETFFFIIIYLVCEDIGTAATPGLLCQPRVIVKMIVEKQMECADWQGKPKF